VLLLPSKRNFVWKEHGSLLHRPPPQLGISAAGSSGPIHSIQHRVDLAKFSSRCYISHRDTRQGCRHYFVNGARSVTAEILERSLFENRAGEIKRRAPSTAFKPGQSGNPGGRPKGLRDVVELARLHTPAAIESLVRVMNSDKSPPAAVVAASVALLDRGWGRPMQSNEHSGKDGAPLIPTLSVTLTHASTTNSIGP
jgi:hypothetical protein